MADFFNAVLIASIWGGVFTVIFWLAGRLFQKKLPVSWHYYIWMIVLARLFIPVFITIPIEPAQKLFPDQKQQGIFLEAPASGTVPFNTDQNTPFMEEDTSRQAGYAVNVSVPAQSDFIPDMFFQIKHIWIVWFLIGVLCFMVKVVSYLRYTRKLKANYRQPEGEEQRLFQSLLKKQNIHRKVLLFRNKDVEAPFAIGLLKPAVVLPDREYNPAQLNHIFSHELVHIKRWDIAVKWLYEIAKAIHWFNPFVYMASRKVAFYCEISCDCAVLKNSSLSDRKEYGLTMIALIGQSIRTKTHICVSMTSNKANVKERVQHILNHDQHKKSVALFAAISLVTLALGACSSIQYEETARPEQKNQPVASPVAEKDTVPVAAKTITNVLIAGLDDGGEASRADVIMVASFNGETKKISLLSIPRDTFLSPSADTVAALSQQGVSIPSEIKFGELTAYASGRNEMEYLQAEVGNTLGIPVDYYIQMDLSAFEKIVDAVGGVEMEIPEGGIYYSDPYQNLEIVLDGGRQLLDGKKAMQLVRFRAGYKDGDLGRIGVQQQFIKELYKKAVDGNNLFDKASALLSVLIENTETNLTMGDLASYVQYIPGLTADGLQTFILPYENEIIGSRSYIVIDHGELESVTEQFK